MSHKITVICDHGSGGAGLALAVIVAMILAGSGGAIAAVAHALLVMVIAIGIGFAVLSAAVVTVIIVVRRRRRARWLANPLTAPWRPVVATRPAPLAVQPPRPGVRRAAIQAPHRAAGTVIPAEPVRVPIARLAPRAAPAQLGAGPVDDLSVLAALWGVTPADMQAILGRAGITADLLAARIRGSGDHAPEGDRHERPPE